jgi:hypothetical protein
MKPAKNDPFSGKGSGPKTGPSAGSSDFAKFGDFSFASFGQDRQTKSGPSSEGFGFGDEKTSGFGFGFESKPSGPSKQEPKKSAAIDLLDLGELSAPTPPQPQVTIQNHIATSFTKGNGGEGSKGTENPAPNGTGNGNFGNFDFGFFGGAPNTNTHVTPTNTPIGGFSTNPPQEPPKPELGSALLNAYNAPPPPQQQPPQSANPFGFGKLC